MAIGRPRNKPKPRSRLRAKPWHGNALRRLRLNVTFDGDRPAKQEQVAAAIGVGLNRYFQIETGRAPATRREARELARLFHVDQRELLIEIDTAPSPNIVVRQLKRSA